MKDEFKARRVSMIRKYWQSRNASFSGIHVRNYLGQCAMHGNDSSSPWRLRLDLC